MVIRRATLTDMGQIQLLYYHTIQAVNARHYTQQQITIWVQRCFNPQMWRQKIAEQYFFVAQNAATITGFASITHSGYIDYLFVHKDFQQKGIAAALLEQLLQIAQNLQLAKIWAEVSITARPFFLHKGFKLTKTFISTVNNVAFNDAVMTLELKQ
ncbi:GNAT family N-acetyltransferase [Sphingobacteriales bacterium UPWRP_1]|nr:hypothetical protein BVG80_01155 [Sphingobacteriales bacterium TSM_CSM]PSJ72647.1 GNAT family N-acetyltransferase [Sphingobacteriales bacterium UPWRP_1]